MNNDIWQQVNASFQAGNMAHARDLLEQICRREKRNADARVLLGVANERLGKTQEAAQCYRRATEIKPDYAEAYYNLGNVLAGLDRTDEAISAFEESLQLRPDLYDSRNNLGMLHAASGNSEAAITQFKKVLDANSGFAPAWFNLGNVYESTKQFEQAVSCYEQALRLNSDNHLIKINLATALIALKNYGRAETYLEEVLKQIPSEIIAINNLACIRIIEGHYAEALRLAERADKYYVANVATELNRGRAHAGLGELDEAEECFAHVQRAEPDLIRSMQRAVLARPIPSDIVMGDTSAESVYAELWNERLTRCDWLDYDETLDRIEKIATAPGADTRRCPLNPFFSLHLPVPQSLRQDVASSYSRYIREAVTAGGHETHFSFVPQAKSRLRVAYVSPDFGEHATSHLARSLFRAHDRNKVEVFGYALRDDKTSHFYEDIQQGCDTFRSLVGTSNFDAARQIYDDGIDILIDMAGFTRHSRMEIFAHRPAPIQVAYLGFPGTTGADFMDYILADEVVLPESQWDFFTESPVMLPNSYQVNDRWQPISEESITREQEGLPEDAFVFCCFNGSLKINPTVFQVWMRLLKQVEHSVLWLIADSDVLKSNLRAAAEKSGINGQRLIFARISEKGYHLKRHELADLFLDTSPCGAHTTASDSLWAGLPVLTVAGEGFAARVAASLLTAVGLPELIVSDTKAYFDLAAGLAANPSRLAALRNKLRANRLNCALFDTEKTVSNLERAYAAMWAAYMDGSGPHPIRL